MAPFTGDFTDIIDCVTLMELDPRCYDLLRETTGHSWTSLVSEYGEASMDQTTDNPTDSPVTHSSPVSISQDEEEDVQEVIRALKNYLSAHGLVSTNNGVAGPTTPVTTTRMLEDGQVGLDQAGITDSDVLAGSVAGSVTLVGVTFIGIARKYYY